MIAAEVAAQWCIERNLPTIFRATQRHSDQGESARYFAKHLLKYLIKDEVPPESVLEEYMSKHAGFVLPSTTPGPHVGLGVDAYSKCTSPLRRYGDLVTHFQIESGLREEARLGRSLVGQNGSRDFLEFSREDIDKLIPHLNNQEKIKRTAEKSAVRSWALMALLRAWKFGEAQLPDKLHFMVSARHASSAVGDVPELALHGVVNWYGSKDDSWLRIGDIWQVQIKNICPYSSIFELEPIKMVRSAEERRAEGVITSLYPRFV
jgi:exoribonuclease R